MIDLKQLSQDMDTSVSMWRVKLGEPSLRRKHVKETQSGDFRESASGGPDS